MYLLYLLILIGVIAVALPILLVWGFFHFTATGFGYLDMSLEVGIVLLVIIIALSFVNLPLGKRRLVKINEPYFLGLLTKPVWRNQGVSVNLGGALIPLFVVGYFLSYIPLEPVLISSSVVAFFAFVSARYVEERGVLLSIFLPVLFAVFFSLLLSPEYARETAFCSGVLGVLIGADLLHLPQILLRKGGVMVIGGGGVTDAVFLAGLLSALLAGVSL